jgi:hypothetical protein
MQLCGIIRRVSGSWMRRLLLRRVGVLEKPRVEVFYFGSPRVKETVLMHALVEFLFYDPDKDERKLVKELERLKKEVRVEFVDDKTLEEIKKKYPEET